jgi:hypothetical protein
MVIVNFFACMSMGKDLRLKLIRTAVLKEEAAAVAASTRSEATGSS